MNDDSLIDSIDYKQWVSVERPTLEIISQSADAFVDSLCKKLEALLSHCKTTVFFLGSSTTQLNLKTKTSGCSLVTSSIHRTSRTFSAIDTIKKAFLMSAINAILCVRNLCS